MVTGRRHLICNVRGRSLCKCGCRWLPEINQHVEPASSNVRSAWSRVVLSMHAAAECMGSGQGQRSVMSGSLWHRGWDSIYTILKYVRWLMDVLKSGDRPALRFDGSLIPAGHILAKLSVRRGPHLGFNGLVCWLKGDLADINHTHGLPSVSATNSPCMYCTCTKQSMHAFYGDMNLVDGMVHEPVLRGEYDRYCRSCRVQQK